MSLTSQSSLVSLHPHSENCSFCRFSFFLFFIHYSRGGSADPIAPMYRHPWTQLYDAFIGHARLRHDLLGCSETRSVGAQSVRALWTLPLEYACLEMEFSSCHVLWIEHRHSSTICWQRSEAALVAYSSAAWRSSGGGGGSEMSKSGERLL